MKKLYIQNIDNKIQERSVKVQQKEENKERKPDEQNTFERKRQISSFKSDASHTKSEKTREREAMKSFRFAKTIERESIGKASG